MPASNIFRHFCSLITIFAILSATLSANPKIGDRIVTKKRAQLERINLAKVSHINSPITACLNFIRSRCIELDDTTLDPKLKGVSIIIIQSSSAPKKKNLVTYQARDISVITALTEIAKQSKHDLYTTSGGIVLCPPGTPPFPNKLAKKGDIWDTLYKHTQPPILPPINQAKDK